MSKSKVSKHQERPIKTEPGNKLVYRKSITSSLGKIIDIIDVPFPSPNLVQFPRITRTLGVMGGKPCIKGTRMTVGMIVGQIAEGATFAELIEEFPRLTHEDIQQAIGYAGWLASSNEYELTPAA